MSSFSALQQSSYKQYSRKKNKNKYKNTDILSQTRTHKNQLLAKSLLYVGSVYVCLRVCVSVCGLCCASRMPRVELAA